MINIESSTEYASAQTGILRWDDEVNNKQIERQSKSNDFEKDKT